jgi:2-methylcitrate dehydratase PrpD
MLQNLGKRLEKISFETLPAATVEKTKTAILNYLGGSLPGADADLTASEKALWDGQNCSGDCVVLGHRGKTAPLAAAAINAAMGQVFLQEDCHEYSLSHPGVVVIPAVLAMGQVLGASGKQIIEAVVTGYEAQGRIGLGLITSKFPRNGLRPASFVAPFGSAAGVAKLLGLDRQGIVNALAIAANTSAGVMEFVNTGTPDICIQNCFAAKNGMTAAIMANNGIAAANTILEGRFGMAMAFLNEACDWSGIGEDRDYIMDDTFIKVYPGCGHVLSTAQAAVALTKKYKIDPKDIKSVRVGVRSGSKFFPGCDNDGPFNGTISAMMSQQFAVSSALTKGEVSIDLVKKFDDRDINAMAKKSPSRWTRTSTKWATSICVPRRGHTKRRHRPFRLSGDVVPQTKEGVIERMIHNGKEYFSDGRIKKSWTMPGVLSRWGLSTSLWTLWNQTCDFCLVRLL